jgi:hypothetical protein
VYQQARYDCQQQQHGYQQQHYDYQQQQPVYQHPQHDYQEQVFKPSHYQIQAQSLQLARYQQNTIKFSPNSIEFCP